MLISDHQTAWENFGIVGSQSNKRLLELQESLFIKRVNESLIGINSLRNFYYYSLPFLIILPYVIFGTSVYCTFLLLSWWKLEDGSIALRKLLFMKKK